MQNYVPQIPSILIFWKPVPWKNMMKLNTTFRLCYLIFTLLEIVTVVENGNNQKAPVNLGEKETSVKLRKSFMRCHEKMRLPRQPAPQRMSKNVHL